MPLTTILNAAALAACWVSLAVQLTLTYRSWDASWGTGFKVVAFLMHSHTAVLAALLAIFTNPSQQLLLGAIAPLVLLLAVLWAFTLNGRRSSTAEAGLEEERAGLALVRAQIVTIILHEIRTPLTIIKGYTDMLINGLLGHVPDYLQEPMQGIDVATRRLSILSDHAAALLQDISVISFTAVSMLENIITSPDIWIASRRTPEQIDISLDCPANLLIEGDAFKTHTAVRELVRNAVKFTDPGGTVSVRARAVNGHYVIEVEDTGIGIPDEYRSAIFTETFWQPTNPANRRYEGAGFGLYVVNQLAEQMDGRVEFDSAVGIGSTFRLFLPRRLVK
jgi:signal transduction histidine kinase